MRAAVIGHVEWMEFARVEHVPRPGEIVHALDTWAVPGGGGGVSVVQLQKLAGEAVLFTALGDDELGHRVVTELEALGVRVETTFREVPQRRGFTYIDADGERTITTIGERLGPAGSDPLAWDLLDQTDAVYFTAGDRDALAHGRRARALVATSRVLDDLATFGVRLDAVVGSGNDPSEAYRPIEPPPGLVVATDGANGGWYQVDGEERRRFPAEPPPGPKVDAYGCGDSFAAGLAFGLGAGSPPADAVRLAARCGAACLTGRGPFPGQLTAADL